MAEFALRSDIVISLQTGTTRHLVAGYFLSLLSHEVRRKALSAAGIQSCRYVARFCSCLLGACELTLRSEQPEQVAR